MGVLGAKVRPPKGYQRRVTPSVLSGAQDKGSRLGSGVTGAYRVVQPPHLPETLAFTF